MPSQKHINEAIRLVEETRIRIEESRRIRRDTAETVERTQVSIKNCEDLLKRVQREFFGCEGKFESDRLSVVIATLCQHFQIIRCDDSPANSPGQREMRLADLLPELPCGIAERRHPLVMKPSPLEILVFASDSGAYSISPVTFLTSPRDVCCPSACRVSLGFPNDNGVHFLVSSLDHAHSRTRQTLKLPQGFVLHSLRHTFLTRLGLAGVEAFTITKLAGHSSVTVSQRYVHPTPQGMKHAVARLEDLNRQAIEAGSEPRDRLLPATFSVTLASDALRKSLKGA